MKGDSFFMAKKGQKFNSYTPEFKEKILEEWFVHGKSAMSIAKEYGISNKTIETWIRKEKKPEEYPGHGQKRGRPSEKNEDWKERYEILKKYRAFLKVQREKK